MGRWPGVMVPGEVPAGDAAGGHRRQRGGIMSFVQIIEFHTSKFDEIKALEDQWHKETAGKRPNARITTCQDRDRADHYYVIAEFPSYEEAMRNSDLPETDR